MYSGFFVPVYCQVDENQLWLDYNLTVPVTRKFSYGGDTGIRGFISNSDWNQVVFRPTAKYRFSSIVNIGGGVSGFFTFIKDDDNFHELRIQEEVNVRWPDLSVVEFFYRVRFDQRFFYFQNQPVEPSGRVRFLLGLESQDFRVFGRKRPFYFQIFWEGFTPLRDNSLDELFTNKTRTHFTFGHRLSNKVHYELWYFIEQARVEKQIPLDVRSHIFRIRVYHRLAVNE